MRVQKITALTGAALSVVLATISANPAFAVNDPQEAIRIVPVPVMQEYLYWGVVRSIVGNVIALEQANGSTVEVGLNKLQQGALGLVPGMRIGVRNVDGDLQAVLLPNVDFTVRRVAITRVERVEVQTPPPVFTPPPVVETPPPVVPPQVDINVEQQPAPPPRPIRALW